MWLIALSAALALTPRSQNQGVTGARGGDRRPRHRRSWRCARRPDHASAPGLGSGRSASQPPPHLRRGSFPPLPDGGRRADRRLSCVRTVSPARPTGTPLVVILLGDTRERGSYQRMQSIGPMREGFLRSIYVRDFNHPGADVSSGTRLAALRCIEQALVPDQSPDLPLSKPSDPGPEPLK